MTGKFVTSYKEELHTHTNIIN